MKNNLEISIYTDNIDKYSKEEFIKFLTKTGVEVKSNIPLKLETENINIEYILSNIKNLENEVLLAKLDICIEQFNYSKVSLGKNIFSKKQYPFGKEAHKYMQSANKEIKIQSENCTLQDEIFAYLLSTFILVKCKGVLQDRKDNIIYADKPYTETVKRLSIKIGNLKLNRK